MYYVASPMKVQGSQIRFLRSGYAMTATLERVIWWTISLRDVKPVARLCTAKSMLSFDESGDDPLADGTK